METKEERKPEKLWKQVELADYYGVTIACISLWTKEGMPAYVKHPPRYKFADVDKWVTSRRRGK